MKRALSNGFDCYSSFLDIDDNEIEIQTLTCTEGQFSGEVIEIHYNYYTGNIKAISIYSQFPVNHPHYHKPRFSFNQ